MEDGFIEDDIPRPSLDAPKSEWIDYCVKLEEANASLAARAMELTAFSRRQSMARNMLEKVNSDLADKMEKRKPKGRQRLPVETVTRIKAALADGAGVRAVAKMHHVSAMTVSRYKKAIEHETIV